MHLKMAEGDYFESDSGAVDPNLIFDPTAAPVQEIMDGSLYIRYITVLVTIRKKKRKVKAILTG
jgi:hypothetical protein